MLGRKEGGIGKEGRRIEGGEGKEEGRGERMEEMHYGCQAERERWGRKDLGRN
jgi:hypothetical protein